MSDEKKPTDSSSTESAATEEPGKELDADQLENVAGGLLPAVNEGIFKFQQKWAPDAIKEAALPTESLSLNFKK